MASPNTHNSSAASSEESALSNATLITSVASSTTWSTNHTEGGGYDYELVDGTDTRYECPICLLCLKDPVLTTCGHRFCSSCIHQWVIKENGKCPVDSVSLSHENIFPDNYTRREIMACMAKCPYYKDKPGCTAVLPIAELEQHIQNEHFSSNGYPMTPTSNGLLECPFKEFGCAILLRQDQFDRHHNESMHHHMQLLQAAYRRLKIFSTRPTIDHHEMSRQDSRDSCRWPPDECMSPDEYQFRRQRSWDSVRYARKHRPGASLPMNSLSVGYLPESEEALCQPHGQQHQHQSPKDGHGHGPSEKEKMNGLSSSETGCNGSDPRLQDIFQRLVLLEQNDREKQCKIDKLEQELRSVVNLYSPSAQILKDFTARYCHGVFVWKIENFRKVCSDMRRNPRGLQSPGFYTDTFGYKMCLRFNVTTPSSAGSMCGGASAIPVDVPLEHDEDTFISLYVHFMQGEFDDTLHWPFHGEMKLTVVHPTIPEDSVSEIMFSKPETAAFARPTTNRINPKGFGYAEFCPIHKIFLNGFVKNDTLVCKILAKSNI